MKLTYLPLLLLFIICQNILGQDLRIVVISDLNESYGSVTYSSDVKAAVKKVIALKPDLVLSTGDMVAGQKAGLNYQEMWNAFHKTVTIPFQEAKLPFAVTPGNHDGSAYPNFKAEREFYKNEWKKYKPEMTYLDDQFYPEFYSFSLKDTLFLSLDTTIVGDIPEKQFQWIKKELEAHKQFKHKILFAHVPLYPFAQTKGREHFADKRLDLLMQKYKINFFLSGHNHSYYPGYKTGTYYVGQGCLGAGARILIGETAVSNKSFTVIDRNQNAYKIYAQNGKNFEQTIDHNTLPREINYEDITLIREDLVPSPQ